MTTAPARASWLRPPLAHDHTVLFREATYEDGQPYADDGQDEEDDEEPAIITA